MAVEFINPSVDVIQQAIDSYILNQNKAKLSNWQLLHHHGESGIERAKILSKWVYRAAYSEEQLHILLYNFIYTKSTSAISNQLLSIAYKTQPKSVDISTIKKEAKKLTEGNNTTSSLRTYVKNARDSISAGYRYIKGTGFDKLFENNDLKDSLFTIEECDLGQPPTKTSKTSAHDIRIYKSPGNLFFMKPFELSSKEYQKNIDNGIAEVVYAQIWRYLIGERASESRLVTKNDQIIGICSRGLKGFKEYGKMTDDEKLKTKGLISILVFVYLLMEDDFHIFNYGQANFDGETYFAKIDHDYIVDKWDMLSKDSTKFRIAELSRVLRSKNLTALINLLAANSRFSPGSSNTFLLRAAHTGRASLSDRKKTTTSNSQSAFFRSNLATLNNINEFKSIIDTINQRCNNLQASLFVPLQTQLSSFENSKVNNNKSKVSIKKAEAILNHFIERMQKLKNSLDQKVNK
ncbi:MULTISPECIES: hypothetical protein [Francisella]|uniref:Uncharacterized protein n=1 Tax=Francisella opportunistica TaxID=2016517 RepID=A0A345JTH2_9GAMM|nr:MULTISPECIES: hypothetical protein [Francisella]APC92416.1 hypothetical protein BBG19_1692 [Francisella sp. MA067296]AXH30618.1 hypothetical protein CGC43_08570 [Francisella opportunistica]AXH32258.1 hypothetical protein CGC44_08540 [Francisella opportunistica]AXH33907.1 hypothetical protein CGC45_08600 [Francisella opportunistica]